MKFSFLESIITPYLKFSAKFMVRKHVINFPDTIVDARNILVIMPEKLEDFGIARNYIKMIHNNFSKAALTIIMREQYRNLIGQAKYYGTIFVTSSDKSIFGLPKRELIQKVIASSYDIAIDLNHTFHLFSTYICQKSGAKLRIGLADSERELFYNFSFRMNREEKLEDKYRKMLHYLSATAHKNS